MKIAVTGGSGRIGSETVRQMRLRGHDVVSIDIRPPADTSLPFVVTDLRAASAVLKAFDGCDAVAHLGEWPNVFVSPANTYGHNSEIGSSVIELAQKVGVGRFIYTSTCQVYGYWGTDMAKLPPPTLPMDESVPLMPLNAYALSKAGNEAFARMVSHDTNMPIAAFRFPFVIAENMIDWVGREKRRRNKPMSEGFGTYLHSEDAGLAYCLALENGWDSFEAFHFVADDLLVHGDVAKALRDTWPDYSPPLGLSGEFHPVITTKARNLLGWTPAHSFRQPFLDAFNQLAKTA